MACYVLSQRLDVLQLVPSGRESRKKKSSSSRNSQAFAFSLKLEESSKKQFHVLKGLRFCDRLTVNDNLKACQRLRNRIYKENNTRLFKSTSCQNDAARRYSLHGKHLG